jgi:hypothetical protein
LIWKCSVDEKCVRDKWKTLSSSLSLSVFDVDRCELEILWIHEIFELFDEAFKSFLQRAFIKSFLSISFNFFFINSLKLFVQKSFALTKLSSLFKMILSLVYLTTTQNASHMVKTLEMKKISHNLPSR